LAAPSQKSFEISRYSSVFLLRLARNFWILCERVIWRWYKNPELSRVLWHSTTWIVFAQIPLRNSAFSGIFWEFPKSACSGGWWSARRWLCWVKHATDNDEV